MKELYKAIAKVQQEVGSIQKDSKGYAYSYASLDTIVETITPLMSKYKLGFSQPLDGHKIKTIIFHTETGESIESVIDIPEGVTLKGMNEYQVLGAAITYLKRYSLSSILGLVTDEDTDAAGVQKAKEKLDTTYASYYNGELPPPSEKQKALIRTLAFKKGISEEDIEKRISQLKTVEEASGAINRLKDD